MLSELKKEDSMLSGIYSVTNLINGKRYIGQASTLRERFYRWNYVSKHTYRIRTNNHIKSAFDKYGSDNFKFEIVNICNKEDLNDIEIYYIKAFNSIDNKYGYNHEGGGNNHKVVSKETRELQRKNAMGNQHHLACRHPNGKKRGPPSEETRKKIGDGNRGKIVPEEVRNRISNTCKGIIHDPMTEATRVKLYKSVNMLSTDGELLMRFNSFNDAKRYIQLLYNKKNNNLSNISRAAANPNCTAYGFRWSYA